LAIHPELITADDSTRAAGGRVLSPHFRRMVGYVWGFRRLLAMSFAAAVAFAALHTFSIGSALPVLKIILEEEGLHAWVDRLVASDRLGAALRVWRTDGGTSLLIDRIHQRSPLSGEGLPALSRVDVGKEGTSHWLAGVAAAAAGGDVDLTIVDADGRTHTLTVSLPAADWKMRALHRASTWLPRQTGPTNLRVLVTILAFVCVVVIVANAFRFLAEYWMSRAVLGGMVHLRGQLYARVLRLPMSFFVQSETSDTVSRFVQDVQEIQRGLLALFGKVVQEPLKAIFIFALALMLDWQITLTMTAVAPVAVGIFWAVGRKVKRANKRLLREYGSMIGQLTTTLQAIDVVKAYTAESAEKERMARLDRNVYRHQLRLAVLEAALRPMLEVLAVFGLSCVVVWLGGRVLRGSLDPSEFLQLSLVMGMLLDPLRKLADVYTRVQRSAAGADRIFSVIDAPAEPDVDPADASVAVAPLKEELAFQGVTFTYPGASSPALSDVSLTVRRGECVALVGPNGSGKTTLVNLLQRFYAPDCGRILYDGAGIETLPLAGLRRNMALVTQRAVIFAGTIAENIAYGSPDAAPEAIEAAARRAYADEFIRARGGRYGEPVGEQGVTLSGGQRQRLAIARAVLRDAPILIFDEATSQIDTDSDEKIHRALRELTRGRTTLMIAHRPSTFRFADRIVVMEAGRIVDSGSHEELIARCTLYRILCQADGAGEAQSIPSERGLSHEPEAPAVRRH